ncbi:unnamed protein product [Cuscuta europaea]|uniref:Uncharacterized protein n=1 Tax=Cuscuta europaea TaxID=41803 RepID=A0A9P0ZQS5_CUSEU|nr:unnamed protein product [Cuscuta europaea]
MFFHKHRPCPGRGPPPKPSPPLPQPCKSDPSLPTNPTSMSLSPTHQLPSLHRPPALPIPSLTSLLVALRTNSQAPTGHTPLPIPSPTSCPSLRPYFEIDNGGSDIRNPKSESLHVDVRDPAPAAPNQSRCPSRMTDMARRLLQKSAPRSPFQKELRCVPPESLPHQFEWKEKKGDLENLTGRITYLV